MIRIGLGAGHNIFVYGLVLFGVSVCRFRVCSVLAS